MAGRGEGIIEMKHQRQYVYQECEKCYGLGIIEHEIFLCEPLPDWPEPVCYVCDGIGIVSTGKFILVREDIDE